MLDMVWMVLTKCNLPDVSVAVSAFFIHTNVLQKCAHKHEYGIQLASKTLHIVSNPAYSIYVKAYGDRHNHKAQTCTKAVTAWLKFSRCFLVPAMFVQNRPHVMFHNAWCFLWVYCGLEEGKKKNDKKTQSTAINNAGDILVCRRDVTAAEYCLRLFLLLSFACIFNNSNFLHKQANTQGSQFLIFPAYQLNVAKLYPKSHYF